MEQIPDSLRSALAGRYDLERVIGQGGMATVYLARDARHNREVAVKVVRPEVSASVGSERFLREIQIAAQLHHPHVLTLIDSGEAGGQLYYVMPFVRGESVRGLMQRTGPMEPAAVLAIISDVADALDYAHRHGVVHRDIKPENILLSDGHAFVADFGIAKAVSVATGGHLTKTGFPVGTPGYMSPEQAVASAQIDERTDVFSLAAVAYEMLVGETPGVWIGEEELRVRRFLDAPGAHRERLDRLPGGIESALVQAMALRAGRRFTTPGELVTALRGATGPRPRFSDDQARAIVRRAAELEVARPAPEAMTIGGVERLAAEVGIPPEHVRDAAREVAPLRAGGPTPPVVTKPRRTNPFLGSPTLIILDRIVEGEVPEAEYVPMVEAMRLATSNLGQVSTLGRALAWRSVGQGSAVPRDVHVTLTPRGGQTRIHIEERLSQLSGSLFGGLLGGWGGGGIGLAMGVGMGALHSPLVAGLLVAFNLGGSYSLARFLLRRAHRKRLAELTALADQLADHCTDVLREQLHPGHSTPARHQLPGRP